MSTLSLAHACINTTSLEQTASFYCDALGLERHFDFTRNGKPAGFYLKASNGGFIEVFLVAASEITNGRSLNHFCLETGDLKGLRQRHLDCGYQPGEIKLGADQSWQFWINDPNGLPVEFQEYTAESSQHTGRAVEITW